MPELDGDLLEVLMVMLSDDVCISIYGKDP
jgi:hypothetical protein